MDKKDIESFREASGVLRKTADLFDKLVDIMVDETITDEEREVLMEETMGRLVICTLKAQKIFE